ncbi:metallophosphoesterase [Streptomyces sp. L7]
MSRRLRKIIATTDVHSAFDAATPMLTHLHTARAGSLIVDCGDFFEGSGYYRFGKGKIEREILTSLYDLLAPGNHGWPHYFEPGAARDDRVRQRIRRQRKTALRPGTHQADRRPTGRHHRGDRSPGVQHDPHPRPHRPPRHKPGPCPARG